MAHPKDHAVVPTRIDPYPQGRRTRIGSPFATAGILRMAIAAPAAFFLGIYFWAVALHFDSYILLRDIGPRYILTTMSIGAGLVVLAGPRNRFIFPLWPVLFYLGERTFEVIHLHPFPLAQIESGLISAITIAVVIGSIIPALYYDSVSQMAHLQNRVNDLRPKTDPHQQEGSRWRGLIPTPDTPRSHNSPDR